MAIHREGNISTWNGRKKFACGFLYTYLREMNHLALRLFQSDFVLIRLLQFAQQNVLLRQHFVQLPLKDFDPPVFHRHIAD